MKVDCQYAETHLADLISAASRGEIIEIDSADAYAHIVASPKLSSTGSVVETIGKPASRAHLAGAWEGLVKLPTDEEWLAMDKELENEMNNSVLFPPEHA